MTKRLCFLFATLAVAPVEWGVDLFSDDLVVFKKLIYEMRFDEVSAVYAAFGSFYIGVRCHAADLRNLLNGQLPAPGGKGISPKAIRSS